MRLSELKRLKTFKVKKEFLGKYHADNHEELKADLLKSIQEANLDPSFFSENANAFSFRDRTWLKPKIKKVSYGTIAMRSKDFTFTDETTNSVSYGCELKAENMTDSGFKINAFQGQIEYTLI
jgi:hypothetical protein